MRTLSDRLGEQSYDRFDLSDNAFTNLPDRWTNYVPMRIIDSWKVFTEDERYLIACVADYADTITSMNGCL